MGKERLPRRPDEPEQLPHREPGAATSAPMVRTATMEPPTGIRILPPPADKGRIGRAAESGVDFPKVRRAASSET